MRDRLQDALKHSTADYCEIRVSVEESLHLAYRGKEAESVASSSGCGGIVRACTNGGWGAVSFDSLERLPARVREACECAALVGCEKTELAEVAPVFGEKRVAMKRDFRGVSLDEKIRLVQAYNALLMGRHPAILSSWVSYTERFRTVFFAAANGAWYAEDRPLVALSYSARAKKDALVQRTFDDVGSPDDFAVALGREASVIEVADRAVALLDAPPCEGGAQSVILDPSLAGVFVHEAFGHLSEADFLYENPRMRDLMHLGREMGSKDLNISDDGTYPGAVGTHAYDDEGTPASRVRLVTGGVLTSHLHSRETAAKMGEAPTGTARACNRNHPPVVRMRNTFIENGTAPVEDLFRGVDRGVYARQGMAGQTEFEMFTFSAGHGYRIENGRRGELVRDVVLTGNVFETLRNIDGIGNDFRAIETAGGCGKSGQGPLPVTFGSPHVRIRNVVVGGK